MAVEPIMLGAYISLVAVLITILTAVWKLSALISSLAKSVTTVEKSVERLHDVLERQLVSMVEHSGRINRTEKDIEDIRIKLDSAA